MEKQKIKVGDIVKITNNGSTYSTYELMFSKLEFNNPICNKAWDNGTLGEVFAIAAHPADERELLALVNSEGQECLIGTRGVEKVTYSRVKSVLPIEVKLNSNYSAIVKQNETVEVGCQTFDFDTITKLWDAVCEMRLKIKK